MDIISLSAAAAAAGADVVEKDTNFNETVLLLHGDGSEGQGSTSDLGNPSYKAFQDNSTSAHVITVEGDAYGNDFSPYYYADGYWSVASDTTGISEFSLTSDFDFIGDFTIEGWFWANSISLESTKYRTIFYDGIASGSTQIYIDGSNGKLGLYDASAARLLSASAVPTGEWVHFAFVRSGGGSNNLSLYINGTRSNQSTYTEGLIGSSGTAKIGCYTSSSGRWDGYISNLKFVKDIAVYSGASLTVPTTPFTDPTTSGELSVYFDGNDYLTLPTTSEHDFGTGDFTVEFWIYPNEALGSGHIFLSAPQNTTTQFGYDTGNGPRFLYFYNGANIIFGGDPGSLVAFAWNHVALVREGTTLSLFSNGNRVGTATHSSSVSFSGLNIGRYHGGGWDMNSYMSNVKLVKGNAIYNPSSTTYTVPTSPLTVDADTKFLGCQSKIFVDESNSSHPITVSGDSRLSEFGPFGDGYWSNYFDGTDDVLNIADDTSLDFGTGNWTIECWFNQTKALSDYQTLWSKYASNAGYYVHTTAAGKILIGISNVTSSTSTATFSLNTWHHLAVTKNSGVLYVWLDGVEIDTLTSASSLDNSTPFLIGNLNGFSRYFGGFISNFRVIKGTALYTSTFTPSTSPFTTTSQSATASEVKLLTCQSNRFIDNSSTGHSITVNGNTKIDESIPFEYLRRQTKLITCQGNRFKDIIPGRHGLTKLGKPRISTASPFTVTKTENVGSGFFDGSGDDHLILPASDDLNLGTANFTVEFWTYITNDINSDTTYQMPISATNTTARYISLRNGGSYGAVQILVGGSNYNINLSSNPQNAWHHFAVVRTNLTTVELFYDGVSQGTVTVVDVEDFNFSNGGGGTNAAVNIAAWHNNGYPVFGYISDLRIVKGTAVYTSGFIPPTTSLTSTGSETKLLTCQYSGAVRNVGFLDDSKYNHQITRNGDVAMGTFSPFSLEEGYWSNLIKSGDDLDVLSFNKALSNQWSFEFWYFKLDGGTQVVISTDSGDQFQCAILASTVSFYYNGGNNIDVTSNYKENNWVHFLITKDSSNRTRLFLNGVLKGTNASSTATPTLQHFRIGDQRNTGSHPSFGYISNVRFVIGSIPTSYQTSETSVGTSVFTSPSSFLTTTSQGATSGDVELLTCQSNRLKDNSSNDFEITVASNTPEVQPFSPFAPTRSYSKNAVGGSAFSDSSGDYLQLTDTNFSDFDFGTGPFLIEGWVYFTSAGTTILGQTGWGNVLQRSSNVFQFYQAASSGNSGAYWITGTTTLKTNEWTHFAIQRDSSGNLDLWVNGSRDATNTTYASTAMKFHSSKGDITLRYWNGGASSGKDYISNFRIKNSAVYTSGATITVPTAPFTADANTVLLLNNNNAGIIDHTMKNNIDTENGVRISTIQNKFGTGSIFFPSSPSAEDQINIPYQEHHQLGTGEFTVELFVYLTSTAPTQGFLGNDTPGWYFQIYGNELEFAQGSGAAIERAWTHNINQWYHLAVTRDSSNDIRIFVDGTQQGAVVNNTTNFNHASNGLQIGGIGPTSPRYFQGGYMDEIRITKGVARYITDFTVPLKAFPNS